MNRFDRWNGVQTVRAALLVVAPVVAISGCDFSVSNPGPIQDKFLERREAHQAMVNGAGRQLAEALNWTSYTGGAVSREIHPAGSTGSFGITPRQQQGTLTPDETSTQWNLASRARWMSESNAARIEEALGSEFNQSEHGAQILLWAGYSNRHLGENWCEAVIDGGGLQPRDVFFERAEANFSRAMQVATAAGESDLATAAQAGRAAVRVHRGDWTGAASDAAAVPTSFSYAMPYFANEIDLFNRVFYASANQPYRAHTVWNTAYEQYYTDTQDPRVAWTTDPNQPVGDGAVGDLGRVPWYIQQKHTQRDSPINLSTGREMRLIEAEASLRGGDVPGAISIINDLRTSAGAPTVAAATAEEAWTVLKRERGIELWLESRRLGDRYRWNAEGTPGDLHLLEIESEESRLTDQSLCFPIPDSERQTNPNIPTS
jgi:hypothetical protein